MGPAWSLLQTHKNHKENQTSAPSRRITYFIFDIPVTAFSHATTARAQYKWRTVVKDREILTYLQQPHVSIWIYLKGRFCYQRGIESTRQQLWKGCLSHKNTLSGWSGGAKLLCILHHWGVQLILAHSWARPAILVVGKGRGGMFLFLLFLHFHSCSSFFPVPLFHLLYSFFYLFSPFLWETTQNDPQGLMCR